MDALRPAWQPSQQVVDDSFCSVALQNVSASGVRSLFVELTISAVPDAIEIVDSRPTLRSGLAGFYSFSYAAAAMKLFRKSLDPSRGDAPEIPAFDDNELERIDRGWRLSFEWDALQPSRTRIVKPILYVFAEVPSQLKIKALVYADSFAEPLSLEATVLMELRREELNFAAVLPIWQEFLKKEESSAGP